MKAPVLIALSCLLVGPVAGRGEESFPVSIVELIATPEKFDGKLVSVIGFLGMGERAALCMYREDAEHGLPNAVIIIPSEEMRRHREQLNRMYVVVVGVFHAVPGAGGRPVRVLKEIKRCTVWSDPARPFSDESYGKRRAEPRDR